MLPKRTELDQILKTAKEVKARQAEEKRMKEEEAALKKQQEEAQRLKEEIAVRIKYIEDRICAYIKEGKHLVEIEYGDGHTKEPVWDAAVAKLKKVNQDYKFSIDSITIMCDNYAEAANVDYVNAREWYEGRWRLAVTW